MERLNRCIMISAAFFAALIFCFAPSGFAEEMSENRYGEESGGHLDGRFSEWGDRADDGWADDWDDRDDDWDDRDDDWDDDRDDRDGDDRDDRDDDDYDDIKEYLRDLPDTAEALAEEDVVVVTFSGNIRNFDRWLSFASSAASGEPCSVVTAQFTVEGDAVLDYIRFDGERFLSVHDNSRDHYYLGSSYIVRKYRYLSGFDEEGRSCLLSADTESSGSCGDAEAWEAAVLTADEPYDLDEVYTEIGEDILGTNPPTVLFDRISCGEDADILSEDRSADYEEEEF